MNPLFRSGAETKAKMYKRKLLGPQMEALLKALQEEMSNQCPECVNSRENKLCPFHDGSDCV